MGGTSGGSTIDKHHRGLASGLALLLLALVLTGCGAAAPAGVPPATVAAFPGNANPPLLVDASWLRQQQAHNAGHLRILDLSSLAVYHAGHIPGAVHAWWQDSMWMNYPVYGVIRFEQEPVADAHNVIAGWGIDDATQVVAYDNQDNRYAAEIVWWLRALGIRNAAVLDGGLAAWRGTGGDISTKSITPPPATDLTLHPDKSLLIGTTDLNRRLKQPDLVIVDTRTPAEAADTINDTVKRGRIPGAVRIPWTATLRDQSGRLKSPAELRQLFQAAGVTPDKTVVVYARFGVEAAQPWFVLSLLGYRHVLIYDQGWAEWGAKPGLPIAPL